MMPPGGSKPHRCAPMRASPSARRQSLANLRRCLLLPGFGAGGSGQLQHGGTLAHTQAREQHHLPVREFKRIVMGHGVVNVDLPEAREPLPDLLVATTATQIRARACARYGVLVVGEEMKG
jgi:hypothetical protein